MKKLLLSLALGALSFSALTSASAATFETIEKATLNFVGIENNGTVVYLGMTTNTAGCLYSGVYFSGTSIEDRKAVLSVALAAKLSSSTVRIVYTQPGGFGTACLGTSIYIE
ncbi:MAG: hypothetical protein RL748_1990 [Pseudomonadota bacterium]|jgi:hypothetical protein